MGVKFIFEAYFKILLDLIFRLKDLKPTLISHQMNRIYNLKIHTY